MIAKFRGRSLKINIDHHLTSTTSKGLSENFKKMSWDNPVSPIDAKNSLDFQVIVVEAGITFLKIFIPQNVMIGFQSLQPCFLGVQQISSIIRKQNHKGLISLYGNIIIVARIDVMILYLFSTADKHFIRSTEFNENLSQ